MRFGINSFLFTSPFTTKSTSLFSKFKKWGFDTIEIPIEAPEHIDSVKVRKALDKQKVAEGIEKDLRDLDAQIRKAEKLLQDQTLNAAERERRRKQQQKTINEARETAQALQQYKRAMQTELQKEQADIINKLMDEVREVVSTIAKAKGYSLVIDSSAKTGPGLVLVFADGKNDLTSSAQTQLEATNPEKTSVNPKAPKKKG